MLRPLLDDMSRRVPGSGGSWRGTRQTAGKNLTPELRSTRVTRAIHAALRRRASIGTPRTRMRAASGMAVMVPSGLWTWIGAASGLSGAPILPSRISSILPG